MAAKTVMHDELTGVTLILNNDETTDLLTVSVNGHEVVVSPEEKHNRLYTVAKTLQALMREIKTDYVDFCVKTGVSPAHTEKYLEFNEAVLKFSE